MPPLLTPDWLAHRYDPGHDAVHLLRIDRATRNRITFLTPEHLPAGLETRILTRADALAAAPAPAPLHFIFHSAFCCSTLLAAAFDRPGLASSLKEPVILNDLVGWTRQGAHRPKVAEVLDHSLRLLARPFEAGEAVVVKPSNIVNGFARVMLTMRLEARAVLLHAPLRVFLTSVAKKGLDGRLWVRELFIGQRQDGLTQRLSFDDRAHFGQTDLQIAAAGWLAQHALFGDLVAQFGRARVAMLDSETLLARPEAALAATAAHYGLQLDRAAIGEIVATIFGRNAKSGAAFGKAQREAEYRAAGGAHADEIEKVTLWGEAVAEAAGIALEPGAALLG